MGMRFMDKPSMPGKELTNNQAMLLVGFVLCVFLPLYVIVYYAKFSSWGYNYPTFVTATPLASGADTDIVSGMTDALDYTINYVQVRAFVCVYIFPSQSLTLTLTLTLYYPYHYTSYHSLRTGEHHQHHKLQRSYNQLLRIPIWWP